MNSWLNDFVFWLVKSFVSRQYLHFLLVFICFKRETKMKMLKYQILHEQRTTSSLYFVTMKHF